MGSRKRAPAPPPPPDYMGLANRQAELQNQQMTQQTWANRPDVQTPWGSMTWQATPVTDPATGQQVTQWSQNISLSPDQQAALDSQMRVQQGLSGQAEQFLGRVGESMSQPFNWQGLPAGGGQMSGGNVALGFGGGGPIASQVGGSQHYSSQAGDALMAQARSRLDPRFQQQEEQMRARLANQGIREGSEAFDREMRNFEMARNDAYNDAAFRAAQLQGAEAARLQGMDIGAGAFQNQAQAQQFGQNQALAGFQNQALAQQFGQNLQAANYNNQLRQQAIAEQQMMRNQPLNELNALLTGQQVGSPQFPQFAQAGMGVAPNLLGAAGMDYNAQMGQYNAALANRQQGWNNLFGGIGAAAQIAGMFSDRVLKSDIKRIGTTARGTPVYEFTMHGKRMIGVIAQEAPSDAVIDVAGLLAVDYRRV